jgi:hypothetical protein
MESWEEKVEQYVPGAAAKTLIRAHVQIAIENAKKEAREEYRDHFGSNTVGFRISTATTTTIRPRRNGASTLGSP